MSWTVVAGKSPVQNAGAVVTLTTFTNDSSAKSFDAEIRYDGTNGGWQAACSAAVLKVDGQSKPVFVAPGTQFTIADPSNPTPPTQDQLDQAAYFDAKRKTDTIKRMLDLGSTHVTSQDLATAVSAWNALAYNAAWEGLK